MRKLLAVALLLASTVASAENWKLVTDGAEGTRLLVDTDSVRIDKYQKEKEVGARIYATMEMINNGEEAVFVAVIDADQCLGTQRGGLLLNVYDNKSISNFFWSMDGGKLYDAEGQWLCGYLQGSVETYLKNKQKGPGVKKPAPPKATM